MGRLAIAFCTAVSLAFVPACAKSTIDPEAAKIISLTRETKGTYALYVWNKVTPKDAEPFEEWSAEFHSGDLHRVELPRIRIVADCAAMIGTKLDVETGERFTDTSVAKAACGINANPEMLSARKLGVKSTPFGKATTVQIVDSRERREYDVSEDGVLLRTIILDNDKGRHRWVVAEATHVSRTLPEGDIFSDQSLDRSVVAAEFREQPAGDNKDN
jgi:hypothetical protein